MLKKIVGVVAHPLINVTKGKEIVITTMIALETWFVEQTIAEMLGVAHILTVVSSHDCHFIFNLLIGISCFWPKTIK